VANTGSVAGSEVVQVYVRDVESTVGRPVRELKGFTKVHVEPGASQQVTIELDQRALSYWSVPHHRWVVEPGAFTIEVGRSSRDLPLAQTVTVDGPSVAPPLTKDSTLHEWMADPVGHQLLAEAVAAGQPAAVMDAELLSVVGTMPMSTLANFGGMSLDHQALDQATAAWAERNGQAQPTPQAALSHA
jgi:beta-glucosidase